MSAAKPVEHRSPEDEGAASEDAAKAVEDLRERDIWLALLLSTTAVGDGDKVLGTRLSLHHNFTTGQCNPSYEALAQGTGKTLSAIPKQLKRLEKGGFIRRISSGGRHRNSYKLTVPGGVTGDAGMGSTADEGIGFTRDEHTRFEDLNPRRADRRTLDGGAGEPYPAIHTNREENKERNRERDKYLSDRFEEFWKQYPKRVDKGAARKAFDRAIIKQRVTFEEIKMGVLRYAAQRTDQDPKFTKHASTWLTNECWLDEPQPVAPRPMSRVDSSIEGLFSGLDAGRPLSRESALEGLLGDLTPEDFKRFE